MRPAQGLWHYTSPLHTHWPIYCKRDDLFKASAMTSHVSCAHDTKIIKEWLFFKYHFYQIYLVCMHACIGTYLLQHNRLSQRTTSLYHLVITSSGHQPWWQELLPTELSYWPKKLPWMLTGRKVPLLIFATAMVNIDWASAKAYGCYIQEEWTDRKRFSQNAQHLLAVSQM